MRTAETRKDAVLDTCPKTLHPGPSDKFRYLREHLVGIKKERLATQNGSQIVCRQGVGVVGIESIGGRKEQPQE